MDGKTDFWRDWEDYAHGFGNISGEFWLGQCHTGELKTGWGCCGPQDPDKGIPPAARLPPGNEALHSLTQAGDYSMRVDLRAGDEAVFAQYDSFRVGSAADYYRLHLEGYHGTAGENEPVVSWEDWPKKRRSPLHLPPIPAQVTP